MNRIKNYILNGQGLGIKYLAALAILASLVFAIFVRVEGAQYIPYAPTLPIRQNWSTGYVW